MTPHILLLLLLLFLHSPPRSLAASGAEKQILLDFKNGITSDPRGALSSWTPSGDPCRDFAGVFCDSATGAVQRIVVHHGALVGALTPSLARLSSLQALSLAGNRLFGGVPSSFASLAPTLHKLNLTRNSLSGPVPAFLGTFQSLRLLDLSYNGFSGDVPAALFAQGCFRLRFVSLSHNNLTGIVPTELGNCSRLVGFDFSYNQLTGELPTEICSPPGMYYVSLRSNAMSGTVDDKVKGCQSLDLFDIGSNNFSGAAPFGVLALQNITYLNISSNSFDGSIGDIAACGDRFGSLDASRNHLTGAIPPGLGKCSALRILDLDSNDMDGSIPAVIGGLRSLSVLRLGHNAGINGPIPVELGGIELLQVLDFRDLTLSGTIPGSLSQCRFLLELDLSGNQLQGDIPDTFDNLTYLTVLDLHSNQLAGNIPVSLGKLANLNYLDLSENSLSGSIPPELGGLMNLTYFNVSFNNLSGMIPSSPVLQNFGASAFMHNPLLCGAPLNNNCLQIPGSRGQGSKRLSMSVIIVIIAAAIILVGVCAVCAMNISAYRRRSRQGEEEEVLVSESTVMASPTSDAIIGKLVLFSKSLPSKYEDWEAGTKALIDKDCLIGGGSMGTVYKASFEGGISIAVKKLETLGRISNQDEFEQQMGRLGGINHPNLVAFQGYYWSPTMQLLLYEFVPNGSLCDHLHGIRHPSSRSSRSGGRGELYWDRRFRIALGAARAVAYLHHDCSPQMLHLNIKSSNILLNEQYESKVSDYGMGKLLPILGSYDISKFQMAAGYVAPELASQSSGYSHKCDVFSFGVVLLEIVTGRKPVDGSGAAKAAALRDYVREILEEGTVSDCFDRSLRVFVEAELVQVLKIGLVCTSDVPSKRPSMAEVVQFLESVKTSS